MKQETGNRKQETGNTPHTLVGTSTDSEFFLFGKLIESACVLGAIFVLELAFS